MGILAHVDAGKTTLIEALLYEAGAVRKLGSVDAGSSHLDFHALEQRRGITIYAKQAALECDGVELTLLDTPGHVDFSAEAERTLQVLDYAVLVVDASEGARGHTETLWRMLERYGVPTIVFANKMDLAEQSRGEVVAGLRERLSGACVDFSSMADGAAAAAGAAAGADAWLSPEALEACAATDEQALEEFFETDSLSAETLRRLVAQRAVFPCFFGAALRQDGVGEFARALAQLVEQNAYPDEFGARVFKISHDPAGARLAWLKVTGGALEVKQSIDLVDEAGNRFTEKVDQIRRYTGAKFETSGRCEAGQICAVTGLSHARAGMSQVAQGALAHSAGERAAIVPTMACSVTPHGCDATTLHRALSRLTDEDPLLGVRWDERLQELQVQIMGAIQIEVLQATLAERFGIDAEFGQGSILYRETIEEPVVGVGHFEPLRHYAEVHLLLEPLPAGSGVRFGTRCSTDDLDLNWQRLILTNAMEREHLGVLTGSPLADVRITLIGGRAHNKHTEGGDFRQATYRAIRQGLMQAKSVLLEPWNRFALRVPADQVGRALADLQKMCARYDAPAMSGSFALIEGEVPAAEIVDYALKVAAYTHGEGSLSLEYAGMEPCHNAAGVIGERAYDPEADLANTPDSVFCSHGAGHTVKWSEVAAAAHVEPNPLPPEAWREATPDWFGK